MMKHIDTFLNGITMYRLVLNSLKILVVISIVLALFNVISYSAADLVASFVILAVVCWITNFVMAKLYKVPANIESFAITSCILFFILAPATSLSGALVIVFAAAVSMVSKYVFAINKKHLFNPAAIGALVIGLLGYTQAIWWVGSSVLLPFVAVIGFLIVRKIHRAHLFFAFAISAIAMILAFGLKNGSTISELLPQIITSWPLIFFGTVMLTEPLTMPSTRNYRIVYGILVGVLFGSQFHVGVLFATPELALVVGNLYAFIVSPKYRLKLSLKEKHKLAPDVLELTFTSDEKINFKPGQYLEWTLAHANPDSRGNRRYFTIASSPTEETIKLGIKLALQKPSSFKNALASLAEGNVVFASQLTGDFVLPEDPNKKLVFVAGGIGITPFRSMIKYLIDTHQKRDITLFYVAVSEESFVYRTLFAEAELKVGVKTVYVISNPAVAPKDWKGVVGMITPEVIKTFIPDLTHHEFYLSGPHGMVEAYKKMLVEQHVQNTQINTDYFPGF